MCHVLRLPLFTAATAKRLESNLLFPSFKLGNNNQLTGHCKEDRFRAPLLKLLLNAPDRDFCHLIQVHPVSGRKRLAEGGGADVVIAAYRHILRDTLSDFPQPLHQMVCHLVTVAQECLGKIFRQCDGGIFSFRSSSTHSLLGVSPASCNAH